MGEQLGLDVAGGLGEPVVCMHGPGCPDIVHRAMQVADIAAAGSIFEAVSMVGQVLRRPLTARESGVVEGGWRQLQQAMRRAEAQRWG